MVRQILIPGFGRVTEDGEKDILIPGYGRVHFDQAAVVAGVTNPRSLTLIGVG